MDSINILLFINILLYLLVHNLKINRYTDADVKQIVNSIFGAAMFLVMILMLLPYIWQSKIIAFVDILILLTFLFWLVIVLRKYNNSMRILILKLFSNKLSILESLILTVALVISFLYIDKNIMYWLIPWIIFSISLAKEVIIMSIKLNK